MRPLRQVTNTIFMFAMILCLHRNDAAMDGRGLLLQKNRQSLILLRNTANERFVECKGLTSKPESFLQSTFTIRLNLRGGEDDDDPILGVILTA